MRCRLLYRAVACLTGNPPGTGGAVSRLTLGTGMRVVESGRDSPNSASLAFVACRSLPVTISGSPVMADRSIEVTG